MNDEMQQEQNTQTAGTFIIATALFTLAYIYVQVLWLVFLAFGVIGWISLLKENVEDEHKLRYRIFLAAMAASSLIGIAWGYI